MTAVAARHLAQRALCVTLCHCVTLYHSVQGFQNWSQIAYDCLPCQVLLKTDFEKVPDLTH